MTRQYVGGGGLHLALRETQRHLFDPRVLGAIAIVAVILGFSGPFGTFEALDVPSRLLYWAAVAIISYAVARICGTLLRHWWAVRLQNAALQAAVVGMVAGIPVATAVLIVNLVTFGAERGWRIVSPPVLWLDVTLVIIGVVAISTIVRRSVHQSMDAPPPAPALLERLPLPQRGTLVSLSVTDHYVEVATSKGRALVLIRLSDAIKETSPTAGLRIHRSHWVALDAVARVLRLDGKLVVELTDGRRLPVSRSYAGDLRAAGLMA